MFEGPGVHFVNKWDNAPLKSHYVPGQKKIDIPRRDLTEQSKAANLFSVHSHDVVPVQQLAVLYHLI